jgi:outer membrane protein assembly factor BamB
MSSNSKKQLNMKRISAAAICALMFVSQQTGGFAQDWPQFNGPNRDGKLDPSYQLGEMPTDGLNKKWSAPISGGYSGIAVANGVAVVTDFLIQSGAVTNNAGARDDLTGLERVWCFDAATGNVRWKHADEKKVAISFGIGPRATPTIDGDTVYTLGIEGDLIALNLKTGDSLWSVSLKDRYHTESPVWGFASSPLVDGELLYTLAGGDGSTVVALNKKTGKEIWRAGNAAAIGYCPPTLIGTGTEKQLLVWDAEKLNGIDPVSGKVLWTEPLKPQYEMSISPPLKHNNQLYVSGIGEVSALYNIKPNRAGLDKVWAKNSPKAAVYLSNAAGIFNETLIAGADCGSGNFIGINPKDGTRYWETMKPTSGTDRRASHGTAFVFTVSNGLYYLFSETGDFIISKLSQQGYEEIGRSHLLDPTNTWQGRNVLWSYPAFANGDIFVRNDREIACFDLTP